MAPSTDLSDVPLGNQAPSLAVCPDDLGLGVLALGEALVLAELPGRAHLRVALKHQHPVQTLRVEATRALVRGLAVALGDLRNVSRVDLHFPVRLVHLQETRAASAPAPAPGGTHDGPALAAGSLKETRSFGAGAVQPQPTPVSYLSICVLCV